MQTKNETSKDDRWWRRLLINHLPKGEAPADVYRLAFHLLLGLSAALFASTPILFSVNPLPLSLICAVEGQALPWVLGGLLIGAWRGDASLWYLIGALCSLPLRTLMRLYVAPPKEEAGMTPRDLRRAYAVWLRGGVKRLLQSGGNHAPTPTDAAPPSLAILFSEPFYLRATVSVLCALIPALAVPALSGFAYYDLYGAVFTLSVTPLATTLLAYAVSPPSATRHARRWRLGGALLLCGALCLCGRTVTILGLSPVVIAATLATLYTVRRLGLGASFCVALVCGLCYDPLTVPLFLLIALIYALLREIMGDFTLLPSLLGGAIYLLLCGDSTAFWRMMPSLMAGYVIFGLGKRLHPSASSCSTDRPASNPDDVWKYRFWEQEARHTALIRRLSGMAGAFSHLSEIFRQLEKKAARPSPSALRRLCADAMEIYCSDCACQTVCPEEYSLGVLTTLQAMSRALDERGKISEEELAPEIRARCPHKKAMIDDINHAATRLSYDCLRWESGACFSGECDEMAYLLRDAVRQDATPCEFMPDKAAYEAIRAFLEAHGMAADDVILTGKDRLTLHLIGITPASLTLPAEELRLEMSRLLGAPVSRLHFDSCDRGCLSLHTLPTLRADYVHRSLCCDQAADRQVGGSFCGDTLRVFVSEDGVFYALVCDGMGKGRHAALTSGAAGVFLERTLSAGVEIQTALRMLNHYLLSRSHTPEQEVSSTVDLFSLDLYTGKGYFLKSGAAPSLILRERRLFRLCSHTLPIGILQAIDAQIIPFEVQPGDHILMMSDGVSDLEDGESRQDWLTDYLGGTLPDDDNALIGEIFALARRHGSLDDMSMISIRISGQD